MSEQKTAYPLYWPEGWHYPDNQATVNAEKFLQVKQAHDLLLQNACRHNPNTP